MAGPLMVLPSRKKYPDYYRTVSDPIDLTTIRNNIKRGHYVDMHTFDADFLRLFKNVEVISLFANLHMQGLTVFDS